MRRHSRGKHQRPRSFRAGPVWRIAAVGLAAVVGGYGGWHAAPSLTGVAVPPAVEAAGDGPLRAAVGGVIHPERGSPPEVVAVTGRSSTDGRGHDSWLVPGSEGSGWTVREVVGVDERVPAPTARGVPELPDEAASASDRGTPAGPVLDQPARVAVPAIDVEAPVVPLGLREDGSLQVPSEFDTAGWWQGGSAPGEEGPAVIAGHVDSYTGPAVFHELHRLSAGDEVRVHGKDGTALRFRVDRVEQHAKNAFPTDDVYGDTPDSTLRLITCGGAFDEARGEYSDNVVVFAERLPTQE